MKNRITRMVRCALMTAALALLSPLAIPVGPMPLTLQTFAVALAGAFLGAKGGALSTLCYLALGACGLPIFSGFQGGVGAFLGPTGGFLWSFPLLALTCGLSRRKSLLWAIPLACAGLLIVYAAGAWQFSAYSGQTLRQAIRLAVLPFALKDIASVCAAILAARAVLRRMPADAL